MPCSSIAPPKYIRANHLMFALHEHIQKAIIRKQEPCTTRTQVEEAALLIEHTEPNPHDPPSRQAATTHNPGRHNSAAASAFNQQPLRQGYCQYNGPTRRTYLPDRPYTQRPYPSGANAVPQRFERGRLGMARALGRPNNIPVRRDISQPEQPVRPAP